RAPGTAGSGNSAEHAGAELGPVPTEPSEFIAQGRHAAGRARRRDSVTWLVYLRAAARAFLHPSARVLRIFLTMVSWAQEEQGPARQDNHTAPSGPNVRWSCCSCVNGAFFRVHPGLWSSGTMLCPPR